MNNEYDNLESLAAWHTSMAYQHGIPAWHTSLAYPHGIPAWHLAYPDKPSYST